MAEEARDVEHEPAEQDKEQRQEECVLDGGIGCERDRVLFRLRLDAGRVVLADHVQRPQVQDHHADDEERQQVMQRIKAIEGGIADRIAPPEPGDDRFADPRDRREQIGDDGCRPETHLPPGQHVAEEPGRDHEHEKDHAENPQDLARLLVGAVIHAAEHVDVGGQEKHRGAVPMQIAQQPAVIHVAHDVLDGIEGVVDMRRIVHREHDAGDKLHRQHEAENAAEGPPVVQVAWRRIGDERGMEQPADRQAPLEPSHEGAARLVGGSSAHDRIPKDFKEAQPIRILLSDTNS